MRIFFLWLLFIAGSFKSFSQQQFQLAPPLMQYRSVFFNDTAMLALKFQQAGAAIHYTLNKNEPTEHALLYTHPIVIQDKIVTVKAKVFAKNFLPSDDVQITFIKNGLSIESVECTKPDEKYAGSGSNTLFDNMGGFAQSSAKTWMGFSSDTVSIEVALKQPQKVEEVLLDFLQDEGSWIFLPETVNIYAYGLKDAEYNLINSTHPFANKPTPGSSCVYKIIAGSRKIKTNKLLVQIITVKNIPEWHEAKGKHAWLFIDELKVY